MLTFPMLTETGGKRRSRKSSPRLACRVNRHEPPGNRANWDGTHYVSRCAHCGKDIRRLGHGKWVQDSERWNQPTGLSATRVEAKSNWMKGPEQH